VTRRISFAFLALALAAPLLVGPGSSAAQQGAGAAERQVAHPRVPPRVRQAPTTLTAHEWGVWVVDSGRPTHLSELAAELPPFVQRMAGAVAVAPRPPPPPGPPHPPGPPVPNPGPPPGVVARKPVLFLYATRPTQVRVEVGFTGGEPWMVYPNAQRVDDLTAPGTPGLVWEITVAPTRAPAFQSVHPGHWWKDLRLVGASPIMTNDGQSEAFLFYDGPVAFERSFALSHEQGGAAVTPASNETMLFLCEGQRYVEAEIDPQTWSSTQVTMGDMTQLRARLLQTLQGRGLSAAEARSLLETWRDDLFRDQRSRAIYFVPRDAYDRMLPLRMTPAPDELVRVGLVIDHG